MFSSFGSFLMMSMGGGSHPGFAAAAFGKSKVGAEFDDYTRRVIHHEQQAFREEGFRTCHDFWNQRKCKLYVRSPNDDHPYRMAHVVSWCHERGFLTTAAAMSSSSSSCWSVALQLLHFQVGDRVVIRECPKKHDGKEGIVLKILKHGKFKVKLDNDDLEFITVHPKHLEGVPTTYAVHRMNVHGGGTVQEPNSERTLISLEWVDAASPVLDLDEGTLRAICPTCRAVEPLHKAYDDDDSIVSHQQQQQHECPICMETTSCRILECNHVVCHVCWNQWRNSSSNVPVAPPEIPQDELQRTRDYNYQRLRQVLPHTLGGTASTRTDPPATLDCSTVVERAESHLEGLLECLLREEEGGSEEQGRVGLRQFWKRLLTCSIHVFLIESSVIFLTRRLSITALEIFLQVVHAREEEMTINLPIMFDSEDVQRGYIYSLKAKCCNQLGESHEEEFNYRAAVPWYERSLLYAQKRRLVMSPNDTSAKQAVSTQHCNLGLAQKRAGFLRKAKENYDTSLELHYSEDVARNKETLLEEMKEWTGTSGKLCPGC
jgi:hypothetical protein